MELGQRIKQKRKSERLSAEDLALKLGLKKENIYKWESGSKPSDPEQFNKIVEWLEKNGKDSKNAPVSYLQTRRELKNSPGRKIPIFEAGLATLSNIEQYHDEKPPVEPDFWVTIPQLRDCDYGCRAKGDSMHPLIRNGSLVIGKQLFDSSVIIFGEIYIIHTKNGIETIKYIHPDPDHADSILLVPYNDKARSTPVKKKDILRIYETKAIFQSL